MERELWKSLYRMGLLLDNPWGHWKFSEADILAVYLWAVVHDRPVVWAAAAENWPDELRPAILPSQSTLSRRLRRTSLQQLMSRIEETWLAISGVALWWLRVIDGKPLSVSAVSKDPDAGYGYGAGAKQKGYKLHAVWGAGPLPVAWGLAPMNVNEKTVGRDLIRSLSGGGYLLGDTEYDSNVLYDLAHQSGYQLLVRKYQGGLGHVRHSPWRLRSIELLKRPFGRFVYRFRRQIERDFGCLTNFAAGLNPLPAWVRRYHRVHHWVHAKLLINAARWFRKHKPAVLALA